MSETTCECCGAPTRLAKTLDLHGGFVGMMHKEYVAPQIPLQAAALAALVAWRKAGKAMTSKPKHESGQEYMDRFISALRELKDLADRLISERAVAE